MNQKRQIYFQICHIFFEGIPLEIRQNIFHEFPNQRRHHHHQGGIQKDDDLIF